MNIQVMMKDAIKQEKKKHKKRMKFLRKNKEEFFRVANGLIVIQEYIMRFSFDTASLDIAITGDHHVFKGMFTALRKLGYQCEDKPKDKIIASWCCWWYHEDRYKNTNKDLHPSLWVSFSSTKCRRVKTGTKMVEQVIYETVCD